MPLVAGAALQRLIFRLLGAEKAGAFPAQRKALLCRSVSMAVKKKKHQTQSAKEEKAEKRESKQLNDRYLHHCSRSPSETVELFRHVCRTIDQRLGLTVPRAPDGGHSLQCEIVCLITNLKSGRDCARFGNS